ncbi:glycoside hydrolase family 5 protein [Pedobacter sp. PWIIR3]
MKQLCLSLICFIAFITTNAQPKPVVEHGQLQVVAGRIVDRKGEAPQLRGISMSWSIWGGRKYYNNDVVNWLASDFKASVLRLAMAIEHEGGYLADSARQTELITAAADAAIKNGIYVIIDWHDHHANQHQDKAVQFFSAMAKRYAGKSNVIYEIFNEPERIPWTSIKSYAIPVIEAIRKVDSKNLIIVGSPAWDQDVDVTAKDPITGFRNIAYSFHFYASDPNHQENLMRKVEIAIAAKLPLFVTEWGVGESDGNGLFDLDKTNKWVNWMEKHQLSSANWNVTDKAETTAILKPGAAVSGNWTQDDLTPAGQYIRMKLIEFSASGKSKDK